MRRGPCLSGLMVSFADARESVAVSKDLGPGFDECALRAPPVAHSYPLERTGEAYARVEGGEATGRILLLMG